VVLAQFMFQGNESAKPEQLELEDLHDYVISACAEEFRQSPARIKLKSGEVERGKFTIQDAEGVAKFDVSVRVRKLGKQINSPWSSPAGVAIMSSLKLQRINKIPHH
tara:strand:- start:15761 stop:16081 length:321 start_codon:yes stop_codon:yes gene_type:complete